jgi:hypothetical protein
MESIHERRLTFPQRNWLLLCLLTVIITVLVYYLIDKGSHNTNIHSGEMQTTSGATTVPGDTQHTEGIPPDSLRH